MIRAIEPGKFSTEEILLLQELLKGSIDKVRDIESIISSIVHCPPNFEGYGYFNFHTHEPIGEYALDKLTEKGFKLVDVKMYSSGDYKGIQYKIRAVNWPDVQTNGEHRE